MYNVKAVNRYFRTAIRADVDRIKNDIILTDRQDTIFNMFYIQRKDRFRAGAGLQWQLLQAASFEKPDNTSDAVS